MSGPFTLKCFACGTIYLVAKADSRQRQVDLLAQRPRCINDTGMTFGGQHSARLNKGQPCGAPLGVGTVVGGREPGNPRFRDVRLAEITSLAVVSRDTSQKLHVAEDENTRVRREMAQLRADYEALRATDLAAEVTRLRQKYETPCPGLAKNVDGKIVACGGFLGHPGDCAVVW